ncbi:hypothetical protein HXX76_007818 [Chlamydomonas incerta]|uniref:Uncharacterized protein n=1 Tax=Chlamydomonas incerta TaxID=51695 RepID=A0A835T9N3_CHLIN|nr:hypothetical protein HXX76_007818 [Chlamydomonas incerta]|eukprot:KAG2434090.1 hypothetical protein HXX76_007818 [Chlamydomonas incerta]
MFEEAASRRTASCRTLTSADSSSQAAADVGVMATPRPQPLQAPTAAASVRSQLLIGRRTTADSVVEMSRDTSPRAPEPRRSCLSTAGGAHPATAASGTHDNSSGVQATPGSARASDSAPGGGAAARARRAMSAGSGAPPQQWAQQQPPHATAAAPPPAAARQIHPPPQQHIYQHQHQQPHPAKQPSLKQVLGAIGVVPASSSRGSSSFSCRRREEGAAADARRQGPSSVGQLPAPAGLSSGGSASGRSGRTWSHGVEATAGRAGPGAAPAAAGAHGAGAPLAPSPLFRSSRPAFSSRSMAIHDREQAQEPGSSAAAGAFAGAAGAAAATAAASASVAGVMAGEVKTTGGAHFMSPGGADPSRPRRRSRRLSCSVGMEQLLLAGHGMQAAMAGAAAVQGSLPSASCSGVLGGGGAPGPRYILGASDRSHSHSRRRTSVAALAPALATISDFLSAQHSAGMAAAAGAAVGGVARRASSRTGRRLSAGSAAGGSSLIAVAAAVTAATNSLCNVQRVSTAVDRPASAATAFAASSSPVPSSAVTHARLFGTSSVPASIVLRAGASAHSSVVVGATAAAAELHGASGAASTRASSGVRATVLAASANASGSPYTSTNSSFVFAADGIRPAPLGRAALASASGTGLSRPIALGGHEHGPGQLQQQGPEASWCHNPTFNTTGDSRARSRSGFRYADAGAAAASGGRGRSGEASHVQSPGAEQASQRALLRPPAHAALPMPLPSSAAEEHCLSAATSCTSDGSFVNPAEPPGAEGRMGLSAEAAEMGLRAEAGMGSGGGAGRRVVSRPSRKSSRIPALEAITSGVAASAAVADAVVCELAAGQAHGGADKLQSGSRGVWASLKHVVAAALCCARPTSAR